MLPGWWALNDAVLQALGDAVERVTGRSGLSNDSRNVVAQRRDSTPFLKPDLQAQLIEDEIGDGYFTALAYVDCPFVNPTHELIAELARQGRVGAIITTNFDCTIERALDAAGLDYVRYASPEDFKVWRAFRWASRWSKFTDHLINHRLRLIHCVSDCMVGQQVSISGCNANSSISQL